MKRIHIAFIILAVATVIPGLYFYNVNQGYWWDEAVYLGLARNLYEGNGYFVNMNQDSFRPPFFPALTAGMWWAFGFSEPLVKALPPLFLMLSGIVMYFFGKKLYGMEAGIWASLMLVTSHMFLFYGQKFLTETLFVFLSLMMLYTLYTGMEEKK